MACFLNLVSLVDLCHFQPTFMSTFLNEFHLCSPCFQNQRVAVNTAYSNLIPGAFIILHDLFHMKTGGRVLYRMAGTIKRRVWLQQMGRRYTFIK